MDEKTLAGPSVLAKKTSLSSRRILLLARAILDLMTRSSFLQIHGLLTQITFDPGRHRECMSILSIGKIMMQITEIRTPALLVDLEKVKKNCQEMSGRCKTLGVTLRPHMKTNKTL